MNWIYPIDIKFCQSFSCLIERRKTKRKTKNVVSFIELYSMSGLHANMYEHLDLEWVELYGNLSFYPGSHITISVQASLSVIGRFSPVSTPHWVHEKSDSSNCTYPRRLPVSYFRTTGGFL
jgi:hypothetical protein